jgi:AraC-like DNA-binding protein
MLYDNIELSANKPLQLGIYGVKEYPFHVHKDVLEIIYVLEGSFELTVVNNVLTMAAGDIYVCSPHELHRLSALKGRKCNVLLLYIGLDAYRTEFPDIDTYQFANSAIEKNSDGMKVLGNFLIKMLPRFFSDNPPDQSCLHKIGEDILNILIRNFQCYYMGKYYPEFNNIYRNNEIQLKRIRRILAFIYANYNKPIRIEDAATMEHISTNYLTHIMKNGCGAGFRMLLNMARVEQSAVLLLENEKGLQAIAYECGFSKQKYYDDSFEKVFRVMPMQYRQKYKDSTIKARVRRMPPLSDAKVKQLLGQLCQNKEEIPIDLRSDTPRTPFHKPACIHLHSFAYDHVTDLPVLKQLKKDFSFEAVGIDTAFLRQYKNKILTLKTILSDFRALGVSVWVYVAGNEESRDTKACLRMLKTLIAGQDFVVKAGESGFSATKTIWSGLKYPPCLTLRSMTLRETVYRDGITLLDKQTSESQKYLDSMALMVGKGLKTPLYHMLYFLGRMGDSLIDKGENYFITQTAGTERFQALVYYCDNKTGSLQVNLNIKHITGEYALTRYHLTHEGYSHHNKIMAVLNSEAASEETLRALNETLSPQKTLDILTPDGACNIELNLNPYEVILLAFERL